MEGIRIFTKLQPSTTFLPPDYTGAITFRAYTETIERSQAEPDANLNSCQTTVRQGELWTLATANCDKL